MGICVQDKSKRDLQNRRNNPPPSKKKGYQASTLNPPLLSVQARFTLSKRIQALSRSLPVVFGPISPSSTPSTSFPSRLKSIKKPCGPKDLRPNHKFGLVIRAPCRDHDKTCLVVLPPIHVEIGNDGTLIRSQSLRGRTFSFLVLTSQSFACFR